jgi:16S rRNA (uracil1498-N3)-methyltransferase
MRTLLLPPEFSGADRLTLKGKEARYVSSVLRLQAGDRFDATDRLGVPWTCVVVRSSPGAVEVALEPKAAPAEKADGLGSRRWPDLVLAMGLAKGMKMDLAVRQAVEAGVTSFVPVETERSIPKAVDSGGRTERWARVAKEALQQSGSRLPMPIGEPCALAEFIHAFTPGARRICLYFHESPLDSKGLHGYLGAGADEIVALVGPEGGLSPEETKLLGASGFRAAWLGPRVLRAETAALYAVAAIRTILLERDEWVPSNE